MCSYTPTSVGSLVSESSVKRTSGDASVSAPVAVRCALSFLASALSVRSEPVSGSLIFGSSMRSWACGGARTGRQSEPGAWARGGARGEMAGGGGGAGGGRTPPYESAPSEQMTVLWKVVDLMLACSSITHSTEKASRST